MTHHKSIVIVSLIALMSQWSCTGNNLKQNTHITQLYTHSKYVDSLNYALDKIAKKEILPGFAIAVFSADSIYFMKGYGYSDLDHKKLYTKNTIQSIASISKTLIGVTLMNAVENNLIQLDEEINNILPYQVTNPRQENVPITIRQLATHTSSISDDGNYDKAYIFSEQLQLNQFPEAWAEHIKNYNSNKDMSMAEFLTKTFTEWQTEENFKFEKPGSNYDYSNIGAALLAHCIEIRTGKDYRELTEDLILKPLNMNNSGWQISALDKKNQIAYYNELYNLMPNYEVITYPDGGLYTTVSDLTKYMQDIMQGQKGQGKILEKNSYSTMVENQTPDLDNAVGIIWDLDIDCCIGHGGNDFGTATLAYYDPKSEIGKILFTNITTETEALSDEFYGIFNTMFQYDSMILTDLAQ